MTETFRYRHRSEIERTEWDALADSSSEAWLWHRSDFIDAQLTWPGRHDVSFGVFDADDALCAVMPMWCANARMLRVMQRRYMRSAGLACAPGLAPIKRRELCESVAEYLTNLLEEEDAEHLGVSLSPLAPCVRPPNTPRTNPLFAVGLANASIETWMVDLSQPADKIRKRYTDRARRSLRRAARSDHKLRPAAGCRDLETYYGLHCDTFTRSGGDIEPFDYYRIIFERFVPAGLSRLLFFERDGRVIAGHNTAIYKDAAHYWTGASLPEPDGANHTLFDNQIIAAREHGCAIYETGEACINRGDAKEQGMSEYKRSFGAELMPFYGGRMHSSHLKHRLYRAARELAGRED